MILPKGHGSRHGSVFAGRPSRVRHVPRRRYRQGAYVPRAREGRHRRIQRLQGEPLRPSGGAWLGAVAVELSDDTYVISLSWLLRHRRGTPAAVLIASCCVSVRQRREKLLTAEFHERVALFAMDDGTCTIVYESRDPGI